jgi:hypothetical protein
MGYIKTINEARELLSDRVAFNAGTLTANWEQPQGMEGMLYQERYIVRSYGVEIADFTERAIHPKAYTHSKTTSKHANIVKRAWNLI